ncbi:MAG TPA: helix-turn-helix domain-containing protein, partial [Chloroflexota bacterium]|nr:helix-turn-helix domain-containing protein [Chloroflexota bacterium]
VGQAAAACAVEYLRERAMLEGEQRVRNSFLEDLLSGRVSSLSATRRRAKFLGYDLRGPQTVFVLDLDRFREFVAGNASDEADIQRTKRRFRTAVESWIEGTWKTRAMIWEHSDALVVLTAPGSDSARGDFINRVEGLRTHVQLRLGGPTVSAGIGLPVTNITRLPESFAQAEHAARIGWAIHGSGSTTDYAELGVYRLLFHLREQPELAGFCSQILGPLERYDREHSGQLVETVRMYLDLQGNVTRAADELHLHRNGLLYRLNRIQELAGISLDNPADRLSLQLALVAQPLLRKPPPERPLEIDRDWTAERETA